MRAPIHSEKHYIQTSLTTVLAGAVLNVILIDAVAVKDKNTATEVIEGALVKAVYIELWIRGQDTSPGAVQAALIKAPDRTTPTFTDIGALNNYTNKKNVLYFTQGLTNLNASDANPHFRGWFKLPKGKQRFGLGDRLIISVAALALDVNICGFAIYKEYT